MGLVETFRALEELELAMARLYELLAESHATDTEAARLFLRLAIDEHSHARQVALQRRLVLQLPQPPADIPLYQAETLRLHQEVVTAACAAGKIPLEKAVILAIYFEASAAEHHIGVPLADVDPEISRVVSALGRGDNDHLERLRSFAAGRGISIP